jgi:hypothetical protein
VSTFVLVHGGAHQSWHWHRVRPFLEELGHDTIAPDVPMDDPAAGAGDWADVIVEAIGRAGDRDDLVLVGHSLAGLAIPIVASRVALRRMVFLCANVPVPGLSYEQYVEDHPDAVIVPPLTFDTQGRLTVSWPIARELFYGDCDEALAREAYGHLVPSAALIANRDRCPLDSWPDAPSDYILCAEDRIIGPSWSRRVSVERLGGPAIELPGGHSPFLSRPRHLARVLHGLAVGRSPDAAHG